MGWVYAIVALVAIGAGTTAVVTYNHAITRAEEAEKAADGWKTRATSETKRADRAQGDFDAADEIARQRGIALRDSEARLQRKSSSVASLAATDTSVRGFVATVAPLSLRQLRRVEAGCSIDVSLPCTPRATGVPRGTAAAGPDSGGPPEGERRSEGSVPAKRDGQGAH